MSGLVDHSEDWVFYSELSRKPVQSFDLLG